MASDWRGFAAVYARLGPPLRPSASDMAAFERAIVGNDQSILLLGVTPELASLGEKLQAIDMSRWMIEAVWPGDDHRRQVVHGDWLNVPTPSGRFSAVLGDGALNSLGWSRVPALLREIVRILRPGGVAAIRTFCAPDEREELSAIAADAEAGRIGNFHALKWRIAMSLASSAKDREIPVREIRDGVNGIFPDREALARSAGFEPSEIATIDAYENASHSLAFPRLGDVLSIMSAFGTTTVERSEGYPLADRCPLILLRP